MPAFTNSLWGQKQVGYKVRVLMISKACLVGAYQTKLEEIARHPHVTLRVIVPASWDDPAGRMVLERAHTTGYELLVEPIRLNGQYHFYYFPTLSHHLKTFRPDVLHVDEEPYNLATWLAVRQGRQAGAKTLFFSWQNLAQRYPIPFRWLEQQVLQMADFGIMGNQASVAVWQGKGYRGPYAVIPQFGVSPEVFTPPSRSDAGRGFVMGCANRRLVPAKGVDLLLRAVADLPGVWRLHIAGEGPELPKLVQLAKELGIGERVVFDGAVPSRQMPAYLQQLDVLVLPSRTTPSWKEQFGRVLIEAMSCQRVVVGSDSGEIPNVIGTAGLIFPEGDVDALRCHLHTLWQSPELCESLGKAARQRVLEHYTQAQIATQTVTVYQTLSPTPISY